MNKKVREAINSIPAESSPGLDGMKLLEMKDIISLSAGEAGQYFLFSGQLPLLLISNFLENDIFH
jgi:hypothetical protein